MQEIPVRFCMEPLRTGLIFAGSAIPSNIVSLAQSKLKLTLMIGRFIGFSFEETR
jgi:hypothetical protein